MKSPALLGLFAFFIVSCVEPPSAFEQMSDSGDIAVSQAELLGTSEIQCHSNGTIEACIDPGGAEAQTQNTFALTRTVLRSAAFLECMDKAMRIGVDSATTDTKMHEVTDVARCGGAPVNTYDYAKWGPYVSCRPQHEGGAANGTAATGWLNHDGAWNELVDRQIARVFTALQQDIDVRLTVDNRGKNGMRQAGLAADGTMAQVYGFGPLTFVPTLGGNRIGDVGNHDGLVPALVHEYLHDIGYDHGCAGSGHSANNLDHGNCGRMPGAGNWNPMNAMNNLAAFCAKEVALRSAKQSNTGCGHPIVSGFEDLVHCDGDNGRMIVSEFGATANTHVDCHCVPDMATFGEGATGTRLGAALAVGNFDGDNYNDLAVGAPGTATSHANTGVFLYRGSSQGLRPWKHFAPANLGTNSAGSLCGTALAVGNFNADPVQDLAISCPGANAGLGRVVVLQGCGANCPASTRGLQLPRIHAMNGSGNTRALGASLATARFNDDAWDDLVIGAPKSLVGGIAAGVVEVWTQVSPTLMVRDGTIPPASPQANQEFGAALAAGNITEPPQDDIVVGAPGTSSNRGAAFIISGPSRALSAIGAPTLAAGTRLGASVAAANVRSNAYVDAIVGAPGTSQVFSVAGAPAGIGSLTAALTVAGTSFGTSVAHFGGNDVLVGAPGGAGATYLVRFTGSLAAPYGPVIPALWSARHEAEPGDANGAGNCCRWSIQADDQLIDQDIPCPIDAMSPVSGGQMGGAVIAGDIGQGPQIISGAPAYQNTGAVLVHGGSTTAQEYRVNRSSFYYGGSPQAPRRFGSTQSWSSALCVSSETCVLGDVDGDDDDDVIIFEGNTPGKVSQVWVALANGDQDRFDAPQLFHSNFPCPGPGTCFAGDVSGDGLADVVAFSKGASGDVHFARSDGEQFEDKVSRIWGHDWFCVGQETCALGDVNGDGRKDLVAFNQAAADVWVGLATTPSAAALVKWFEDGELWHTNFCTSTQTCRVGDVDGDLQDDIVAFKLDNADPRVFVALAMPWAQVLQGSFGTWVQQWHFNFAKPGEDPRMYDINGDGADDAVIFNRATGVVSAALSNKRDFGPREVWKTNFCYAFNNLCEVGRVTGFDALGDVVSFGHAAASSASVAAGGQ